MDLYLHEVLKIARVNPMGTGKKLVLTCDRTAQISEQSRRILSELQGFRPACGAEMLTRNGAACPLIPLASSERGQLGPTAVSSPGEPLAGQACPSSLSISRGFPQSAAAIP